MTNREVLNRMNMYDLLCRLNSAKETAGRADCIIQDLEKTKFMLRCGSGAYKGYRACERCINDWLNEESVIQINERISD